MAAAARCCPATSTSTEDEELGVGAKTAQDHRLPRSARGWHALCVECRWRGAQRESEGRAQQPRAVLGRAT
jgi:hypothetical protein